MGLENIETRNNYLEIWNKIDLLSDEEQRFVKENAKRNSYIIPASALSGEGCDEFLKAVDEKLSENHKIIEVEIPSSDGKLIAWLYKNAEVLNIKSQDEKQILKAKIDSLGLAKLGEKTQIKLLG